MTITKPTLPLAVLLVLASSALAQAPQTKPDPETQVRKLLTWFLDGAGRNDRKVHQEFWADDLMYTGSSGAFRTKPEILNSVDSAPKEPKQGEPESRYTAEDVKVNVLDDTTAIVNFRLLQQTRQSGQWRTENQFRNSGTFKLRDGKWQVVIWQATKLPDPGTTKGTKDTK